MTVSGATLRYVTTVYEPDTDPVVIARRRTLKSTDRVTVVADGGATWSPTTRCWNSLAGYAWLIRCWVSLLGASETLLQQVCDECLLVAL